MTVCRAKNVVECVLLQSLQYGPGDTYEVPRNNRTGPFIVNCQPTDNDVYHNDNPSSTIRRKNN